LPALDFPLRSPSKVTLSAPQDDIIPRSFDLTVRPTPTINRRKKFLFPPIFFRSKAQKTHCSCPPPTQARQGPLHACLQFSSHMTDCPDYPLKVSTRVSTATEIKRDPRSLSNFTLEQAPWARRTGGRLIRVVGSSRSDMLSLLE